MSDTPMRADPDRRLRVDDRCWLLTELNEQIPGQGLHRIQRTYLMVDDQLWEYERDLGAAFLYSGAQFRFPCLNEHSVGEALEIAEKARHDDFWQRFIEERRAESDLVSRFINWKEWLWKRKHNQSVFGPGLARQRNDYSLRGEKEHFRAKRLRTAR